jgi:preprotein translocase SecF subunit
MKLIPLHIFPGKTHFDFIGTRWFGFGLSIAFSLIAFAMLFTQGLNWGIDFTGGVLMELRTEQQPPDLARMRAALEGKGLGEINLQPITAKLENGASVQDVLLRIQLAHEAEQGNVVEKVKKLLASAVTGAIDYRDIEAVGSTVSGELKMSGIYATVASCLAIMAYVWFRFEWQFSLGTIFALVHDTIMIVGFYAVSRYEFGLTAVASVLTIIGYSMNDSVVIYDRIRENMRRFKKMPMGELLNQSMNETLGRTVLTSSTTLLAALALALFGGEVIKGFSWSLVFGIVVGTYSSIYISAPTLIYLKMRQDNVALK